MNENEIIREAMRSLGMRTSERKKISSRLNAMKPRKKRRKKRSKQIANTVSPNLPSVPNEGSGD